MTVVRWFFRVAHFAGGNARFSGNQRPEMGAVTRRRGGLIAMKFREGGTNGNAAAGAVRQPHLADVRAWQHEEMRSAVQMKRRAALRRHSRSTVNRRTYQQAGCFEGRCCCRPARPRFCRRPTSPLPLAAALNRGRATTRRVPRSPARTGSTPRETAATCAAPSRDARRSGSRASRSRNRSRRPRRRTRVRASRA